MFKLFCSDKFGFASNILACLSANITWLLGIINEPQKLRLRDVLEITLFSFRTRTFISILAYASINVASGRPVS
jgi:hypothetical protein